VAQFASVSPVLSDCKSFATVESCSETKPAVVAELWMETPEPTIHGERPEPDTIPLHEADPDKTGLAVSR
jgi:hypothetical protein